MIYIHTLKDLNLKSAKIESVDIIREIKRNNRLPLSEEKLRKHFSAFFVSKNDLDVMSQALELIPETIKEILELPKTKGDYEPINFKRACSGLQEIPAPLKSNLDYAKKIFDWQESFISHVTPLLNDIPSVKKQGAAKAYDEKIGSLFEVILRNKDDFIFNFRDIINEAQLTRMNDLAESMDKGFFFHVDLQEYLEKQDFSAIRKRVPRDELEKVDKITKEIKDIQKGVKAAYDHNMKVINLAVVLYAYINWVRGS